MTDLEQWLVDEVTDLLDAGSVGLYEFISLLHSDAGEAHTEIDPGADTTDGITPDPVGVASAALDTLLSSGKGRVWWMQWPEPRPLRRGPGGIDESERWAGPASNDTGLYLALVPPEDEPEP